jgi:hypothetical protein
VSDAPHENRGPDNCDMCGVAAFTSELTDTCGSGEMLCAGCEEKAQLAAAELQAEQASEDFYGGESVGSYGPGDGRGAP